MSKLASSTITTREDRPRVRVLVDRCAGCQECVIRCPAEALSMDTKLWVAVPEDGRCVGCRQCVRTCPFSAIEVEGPLVLEERMPAGHERPLELRGSLAETRLGFASFQEAVREAERCLACPDPTCVRGCPVHNDIPGFIAAVRQGDLDEAHSVLRRTTFLPDVCSRVCDQAVQCEGSCTWSLAGGTPVAIGAIERFIADNAPIPALTKTDDRGSGMRVAVVGSGPAGIGATFELLRSGASVTVFERDDRPGGLLGWGIPDFTLPRAVAERPWEMLQAAGATLRCAEEISLERAEELRRSYDALVLANGAGRPLRVDVPGSTLAGVVDATQFLTTARKAISEGGPCPLLPPRPEDGSARGRTEAGAPISQDWQPTVLVLGAGNTAMDVARSARRLGCHAICVDWMDEAFAPVRPDELAEARFEGVEIRFLSTLQRLEGSDGRVTLAYLAQTSQERATARPKVLGVPAKAVAVDLVVSAMGYRIDPVFGGLAPGSPLPRRAEGIPDRQWQASGILAGGTPAFARRQAVGALALGREVGRLEAALGSSERVFVAGDALVGPSTVVEAMAQGRSAAEAILEARPSASGSRRLESPVRALVAYDSQGGQTKARAQLVAAELARSGSQVELKRIREVTLADLTRADLVVIGTWVQGLVVARVGPARTTLSWLSGIPSLGARKVALFCSYGVAPRGTLATLRKVVSQKGAVVVAEAAFAKHGQDQSVGTAFARQALAGLGGRSTSLEALDPAAPRPAVAGR